MHYSSMKQEKSSVVEIIIPGYEGKGKLFLGNKESSSRDQLRSTLCTRVVCCSQVLHDGIKDKSIRCLKIDPDLDFNNDQIPDPFSSAATFITKSLSSDKVVLVYCESGLNKAAVIVINYIMVTCNFSLAESYKLIEKFSPNISPRPSLVCILIVVEKKQRNNIATMTLNGRSIEYVDTSEKMPWTNYMYIAAFVMLAFASIYSHAMS